MKIMYFKGEHSNFGDELNTWMWSKILPNFFDDDEKVLFIGIGTIVGKDYARGAKKIIFGAACEPRYTIVPDVHHPDWDIYFVRGYRTAQLLDISPDLALGDAAILIRTVVDTQRRSPEVVSLIPHWESLERGNWQQVCRLAGINLIDPRRPIAEVIHELLRSRLVIAEAMHGAIVADALRVPWIPLLPIDDKHRKKWFDWAEPLEISLKPQRLQPSSLREVTTALKCHPFLNSFAYLVSLSPLSALIDKVPIQLAVHRLTQVAATPSYLSDDRVIDRVTERMLEKVQQLQRNQHEP